MAKSRKRGNNNIKIGNNNSSKEVKKILTMTLIVLAFFGLFYLLTLWILDKDISLSNSKNEKNEVEIQNEEILAGTSFTMSDDEYLVLYYDVALDEEESTLSSLVTQYRSSNKDVNLYTVDLSNALNKRFVTDDEGNSSAVNASELKLKNPTLIKFVDGKISEYIDNQEDITAYLK